jgi:signal transduction histidine kinase
MNSLTRLVGYSVLLLLILLGAALAAQSWLHQQTGQLRSETIATRRAQFDAVLAVLPRPLSQWTEADRRQIDAMIGGTVSVLDGGAPASPPDSPALYFDEQVGAPPVTVRVIFPAPPFARLAALNQRVAVGLAMFAAALLGIWFLLVGVAWRRPNQEASRSPWAAARAEMSGLTQLARTSAAQSEELGRERGTRRRAEEDAQLRQRLLAQALEEKIRLGHDLHDGIIQSLYAVGLTLESVRPLVGADPAEADRRLEKCLESLNGTIRDVRSYITGLAPENLRHVGFAQAIETLFADLRADRPVKLELRVDDEATALLSPEQGTDTLQIAREAISNSLRHGGAGSVMVRLHQSNREVCLLVQDNGTGFDPEARTGGQGLGNMQARAARLGATVRVDSRVGAGTRVIVTLPPAPSL